MTRASTALAARSVTVHLGDRLVLDRVEVEVAGGDIVGLIGPNGGGKSTLLRAILGLVPISSGTVQIPPPRRMGEWHAPGYVPQRHDFAWDFPISVLGAVISARTPQVGWLRRVGRDDRRAAQAALELVGLAELARRPVAELSGGQRQRVLVARALAGDSPALLLDEPVTAVDRPTSDALSGVFRRLAREGRAVLMSTHDLDAATSICSRLYLLNRRIVADGPPSSVLEPDVLLRAYAGRDVSDLGSRLPAG